MLALLQIRDCVHGDSDEDTKVDKEAVYTRQAVELAKLIRHEYDGKHSNIEPFHSDYPTVRIMYQLLKLSNQLVSAIHTY